MGDNGQYVPKGVCDERFDRIISNQKEQSSKLDEAIKGINGINTQLAIGTITMEENKKRISIIEDSNKKEKAEEARELKDDRKKLPIRRKEDHKWIIGLAIMFLFNCAGFIMALLAYLK